MGQHDQVSPHQYLAESMRLVTTIYGKHHVASFPLLMFSYFKKMAKANNTRHRPTKTQNHNLPLNETGRTYLRNQSGGVLLNSF
jgi:hypothetical protein